MQRTCYFARVLTNASLFILLFASASPSQTPQNILHPFVGQKLILLHLGDLMGAKIKKTNLATVKGNCDVAVLVREASFDKGRARLRLEDIGFPQVAGAQHSCKQIQNEFALEISGFSPDDTPDSVAASVGQLLLTPEQYLAAQGVPFDLPPGPDDEHVIPLPPKNPPKLLLSIDANFSEEARREKYQGTVVFQIVIGSDGRIHQAKLAHSIGHGLDENALRTLSMWRFNPVREAGRPVACKSTLEVSFRLY
jgi:TonB family protein